MGGVNPSGETVGYSIQSVERAPAEAVVG